MITAILVAAFLQVPQDLDGAIDRLAAIKPGDGAAYVAARDAIVALGKDALPTLKAAAAPDRWTGSGWVRALAAESCRVRIEDPAFAASIDRPEGLDPAHYRLFRHASPMVMPALSRHGTAAIPLLLERWRWTFDLHPFTEGEAGTKERATFRNAILTLPGQAGDGRARPFLDGVVASASNRDAWRGDAAVSLGIVGGVSALPRLTGILDDTTQPAAVREACARALGRIPDAAALEAIRGRVFGEKDEQVRRSYFHGLGFLGSAWAWESRGGNVASLADAIRSGCGELLVDGLRRHPAEAETIGVSLSMTASAPSLTSLESIAADASASAEVKAAVEKVLPALRRSVARKR